ncbi:MAG: GNAT family N-acetyltransferase [Parcubacteria group bacterium]|nr:GNAT family N-acetyltransferase [Parcubacteria group bacterium]
MLKPGIYRHYKGKDYRIVGVAKHSETLENFVVYEALYNNKLPQLWVRPLTMFTEKVEINGKKVPRFEYVGNSEVTLQRAVSKDADVYLAIEKSVMRLFRDTYSGIESRKEASEEIRSQVAYLIKKSGKVVGTVQYIRKGKDRAHISGLAIQPKFHRQGIGRMAIELILKELKGIKKISLVTHPKNTPAITLYLSLGFVIEGWKDNYYGDGEPRILMARTVG